MSENIKPPLPSSTLVIAKKLRKQSTDAELQLWYYLRARRTLNLKWRRQHPIPPYVADFYCYQAKLVVELDGVSMMSRKAQNERSSFVSKVLRCYGFGIMMSC